MTAYGHQFSQLVPVIRCGHAAGVGGEADRHDVPAEPLARELPDIELALQGHVRSARVTQVRVVRPHQPDRARSHDREWRNGRGRPSPSSPVLGVTWLKQIADFGVRRL